MAPVLLIFLRISCYVMSVLFSAKTKTPLGLISDSKFMARLSDWMGAVAGLGGHGRISPPPPGSATDRREVGVQTPLSKCGKFCQSKNSSLEGCFKYFCDLSFSCCRSFRFINVCVCLCVLYTVNNVKCVLFTSECT